jgi:hypothetical protein
MINDVVPGAARDAVPRAELTIMGSGLAAPAVSTAATEVIADRAT